MSIPDLDRALWNVRHTVTHGGLYLSESNRAKMLRLIDVIEAVARQCPHHPLGCSVLEDKEPGD